VVNLTISSPSKITLSNIEEIGELFDIVLRPLMRRNARTMYAIFIEEMVEYLTTLDIQNRLREKNVKLSKKEINAWLKSLQEAGLIDRGKVRGKPTTLDYDDKYTFDMWSLTLLGQEMSNSIASLLNREDTSFVQSFPEIREVPYDLEIRAKFFRQLEGRYLKLAVMRRLFNEGQGITIQIIKKNSLIPNSKIDIIIDELITNNLIQKALSAPSKSLISRLKMLLGILKEFVVLKLTDEGSEMISSFL
jgi:predicted transcriptional regulator